MSNIIVPRRREDFFDEKGNPTLRFIKFLELMTETTNDSTSAINDMFSNTFNSQLQQITKELEGLPEFTVDTTGFTADTTLITADKVNA